MIGIYKITSPSERIYIGQSISLETRFLDYQRFKCKAQKRLYNSLLKYGISNHKFEIIEECSTDLLNDRERYWQEYYNVLDKYKGLNCKLTQSGNKSGKYSEELKDKIRLANRGKKRSPEQIQRISEAKKGNQIWLGKKHSKESKIKMSVSGKGKSLGIKNAKSRPIVQYSLEGIPLKIYESANLAAQHLNLIASKIGLCCSGKRNKHGNYIFQYI